MTAVMLAREPDAAEAEVAERLTDAARALAPALARRAQGCEVLRRVPDETIAELHRAGLFRITQPRRVGGAELDPAIYFHVCAELARACPSSAWVLGNLAAHHQFLALWPGAAQDEVWDPDPDVLIGSSYVFAAGRAEPAAGGYRLSGRWPFSSGISPCLWTVVGATAPAAVGAREQRYFLVPRQDFTELDTWRAAGLAGTGSHDLEIRDVFVPTHRTLAYTDAVNATAPGLARNPAPLFRFPMHAAGGLVLIGTLYGAALGALDHFIAATTRRMARASGVSLAALPTVQLKVAEAAASLDAARTVTLAAYATVMRGLDAGRCLDGLTAARIRRDAAHCARLCVHAVDTVFAASGGGALDLASPVQRAWRDVHAGAAHFGLQWDVAGAAYGRVALGLPDEAAGIAV